MSKVKIAFALAKDTDDYPPFDVESLWGTPTDVPLQYTIDNIPFFARQATLGDVVRVEWIDGRLEFADVVARSSNSLIRVVVYDKAMIAGVRSELRALGCSTEEFTSSLLLAVDIPCDANLVDVQEYLSGLEPEGSPRFGRVSGENRSG